MVVAFWNCSKISIGFRISVLSASKAAGSSTGMVLFSTMNLIAALAAIRPSACDPEENLWLEAPEASPAQKRPFTVDMCA